MIAKLGRRLSLRQIILSTAEVYISRFLTKVSILEMNIHMLITACVYISCKINENPQHIRTVLNEARNCWPDFISPDFTKLAEFEFYIIEELDCYLIIHHPYNALSQLVDVLGNSNNEKNTLYRLDLSNNEIENAWKIVNDSYMTDLPLLFPPHIIAIAALHLVLVLSIDEDIEQLSTLSSVSFNGTQDSNNNNNTNSNGNGNIGNNEGNILPTLSISKSKNKSMIKIKSNSSATPPQSHTINSISMNGYGNSSKNSSNNGNKINKTIGSTTISTNSNNNSSNNTINTPLMRRKMSNQGQPRKISGSITGATSNKGIPGKPHTFKQQQIQQQAQQQNSNEPQNQPTHLAQQHPRLRAFTNFLAGSNINIAEVVEAVQDLLSLYENWAVYDEGAVRVPLRSLFIALQGNS